MAAEMFDVYDNRGKESKGEDIYRCKQCRAGLFRKPIHNNPYCTSYFIDQPNWLNSEELENSSKLNCPKCKHKIGYVIFSGKKCSCGQWIVPGIQVHKVKVDYIRSQLKLI